MTPPAPAPFPRSAAHRPLPPVSDERLLEVARRMPAFLYELRIEADGTHRFGYVGDGVRTLVGIEPADVRADPQRLLSRIHAEDGAQLRVAGQVAARDGTAMQQEFRVKPPGRPWRWIELHAQPTPHADGSVSWHGWFLDVTDRKRAETALADSEQRHRQLFASNPVPMWVHDRLTLRVLTVNDAAMAHYGWTREEFLAMTHVDLRYPTGAGDEADAPEADGRPVTVHHRTKGGRVIEVELSTRPITWDGRPARLVIALDVTARRRAEAEIQRLAYYDTLTQLPNRRLLVDRLRQAVAASHRSGLRGAVLFVDIDDFKRVNDTRGHPVGDQVLIEAAARLRDCVRAEDTVARIGGDEFVVLMERFDVDPRQAAARADEAAQRVLDALSRPFDLPGLRFHGSASVGVATFGERGDRVEDLLMHADSAMYRAKAAGRGTIRFYDPAMQVALQSRAALETDLRRALSEGELRLAYQAQVDVSRRVVGAEVLLRWQHPERGPIQPMDFIPLAEETGLIVPIGQWVLETACAQLAGWARSPHTRELLLSVNVSARQFRQPDFVQRVERALADSGALPSRLRLELTESLLLDNVSDCIAKMQSLKSMGVGFALDDFGTGYSSLSYLKRLPLDELKIDRSFIRDITTDPSDAAIVQTIIGMARTLGLEVVAEGVETFEQMDFLARHGCGAYQGWYFGKAVPLPEFEATLREPAGAPAPAAPAAAAARTRAVGSRTTAPVAAAVADARRGLPADPAHDGGPVRA
ncbi:MAG TPA: EAL domain-containing protein [Burkholderiaceae bacterium]|nr:EAL domain-containing protein [Burkholderiaceae bacterium]